MEYIIGILIFGIVLWPGRLCGQGEADEVGMLMMGADYGHSLTILP